MSHSLFNAAPHIYNPFRVTQESLSEAKRAFTSKSHPMAILKPLKPNAMDDYDAAVKKNSMRLRGGAPWVRVLQF